MKKFLSVLLAVLMLVPCVAIPSVAAANTVSHSVTITGCDYTVRGWGGILKAGSVIEGSEDGQIISTVFPAGKKQGAIAALMLSYTSDKDVDISAYTKACVRAYITNVELMGQVMVDVELTSGGTCDIEESAIHVALNELAGGALTEGWNTLTWDIPSGGLKPAEWDFFRMFNNQSDFTPEVDTTFAVDGFWFEDNDGNKLPISDCKMELAGWEGKAVAIPNPTDEDSYKAQGTSYMKSELSGEKLDLTLTIEKEKSYIDTTKCDTKFLSFDFYTETPDAVKGDITFEVIEGASKMTFTHDLKSIVDEGVKEGWNKATIALTSKDEAEYKAVNQLKVYTSEALTGVFGLDYIRVVDGITTEGDGQMHETFNAEMDKYLADGVYKFPVVHGAYGESAVLLAKTSGKLNLQVSMDGQNWTDVVKTDLDLKESYRKYDLNGIVDFAKSNDIYVKAASGAIKSEDMVLDVIFNVPADNENPHLKLISACDSLAGWSTKAEVDKENKSQGTGSLALTLTDEVKDGNVLFQFKAADTKTTSYDITDIIGVGGLYLDVYFATEEDAATLGALSVCIEVTSSGSCDKEEIASVFKLADLCKKGLTKGWNELVIPFSSLTGKTGGDLNTANFNYVRIYTQGNSTPVACGEGITFNIDNLRLWDGNDGSEIDSYKFTVFADDEKEYYVEESSNAPTNDSCRFCDADKVVVYKFALKHIIDVKEITFTATVGQQLVLDVSVDGVNWQNVYTEPKPDTESGGLAIKEYTYDLTEFVDLEVPNFDNIWLRISDSVPENGWGGAIYKNTEAHLDVKYIKPITDEDLDKYENTATLHSKPLPITNVIWAGGLEKDIVYSGSSAIRYIPIKGVYAPSVNFEDTPVDATGMDTFEMEIYFGSDNVISQIRDNTQGEIELTSSGVCDNEETRFTWTDLFASIGQDIPVGEWLHVSMPIPDGGCDLSNINFFRPYYINNESEIDTEDENNFVLFDNIRLTDKQAQEAKKFQPEADKIAAVIEELQKVWTDNGEAVTDENVNTIKAAYDKANEAYTNGSAEAKELIDSALKRVLTSTVKKALTNYEKAQSETKAPDVTEAPGNETEAGGNETEPTTEPENKSNTGLIIGIVAGVVVVAGAVVGIILAKKKKK